MAVEPLTELEAAPETVVTTLSSSAGRESQRGSLSISKLRELATQQLLHLLEDVGPLGDKMKSVIHDSELKFNESWGLTGQPTTKEIRKEKGPKIWKK